MTAESLKLNLSSSEDEEDNVTSEHNDGGTSSTSKLDKAQTKRNLEAAFKQIFKNVNGYMKQNKNGDWVPVNEDDPKSQKPVDMMVSSVALHGGLQGCWLTNSILDGTNLVMERVEKSSQDRNMERETIEWLRDAVLEQQQHFKVLCDAAFEKGQAVATASIQGLATEKTALEKSNQQLNEKIKHLETIRTEHQTQEACDNERIRKLESEVEELKTQLEATKRSATGGNADGVSASAPASEVTLSALKTFSLKLRDLGRNMTTGFETIQAAQAEHTEELKRVSKVCTGEESGSGEEERTQSDGEEQILASASPSVHTQHVQQTPPPPNNELKAYFPSTWTKNPCEACELFINPSTHLILNHTGPKKWHCGQCTYSKADQRNLSDEQQQHIAMINMPIDKMILRDDHKYNWVMEIQRTIAAKGSKKRKRNEATGSGGAAKNP